MCLFSQTSIYWHLLHEPSKSSHWCYPVTPKTNYRYQVPISQKAIQVPLISNNLRLDQNPEENQDNSPKFVKMGSVYMVKTFHGLIWIMCSKLEINQSSALYCFFFKFIYFSWRLITLQYCSGFCHTLTWISHGFICAPHPEPPSHLPLYPIPLGHPSAPALSTLSHASNLDWWSLSYAIIYMFQCYSLRSSHPHLLPQSPKYCSIHLCLFFCLAYKVIITIFLNSIYMCQYTVLMLLFLVYFILYNGLQFHPSH